MPVSSATDPRSLKRKVLDTPASLDSLMKRRMLTSHRRLWFSPGHVFRIQEQERMILKLLAREGLDGLEDRTVIDLGCGFGFWLNAFIKWGARPHNVFGVDLMPERVEYAKAVTPDGATLECRSAERLDFDDESFDVVLLFLLLSQVKDGAIRERIAQEAIRVVRPGGFVLWYDYRSLLEREFIPLKKSAVRGLFPDCDIRLKSVSPVGPVVRRIAPYSWMMCQLLGAIPPLRTHYLGVIRPRWNDAARG